MATIKKSKKKATTFETFKDTMRKGVDAIVKDFQHEEVKGYELDFGGLPPEEPTHDVNDPPLFHEAVNDADLDIGPTHLIDEDEEDEVPWEPKRRETVTLTFTLAQLSHLYDLLGLRLSSDEGSEVSLALARATANEPAEQQLVEKIGAACVNAGLPIEDEAFDYIIGPTEAPKLGIFPLDER